MSAGIYAARKKIKSLIIVESFGGQSIVSANIENWIGMPSVSGYDLAKSLENHLRSFAGSIDIAEGERAEKIEKIDGGFRIKTVSGKIFETKYILLATGSRRRRLGVPGEDKYDGKGVVFCSICDAPLFKDKDVAVVGGGNAGLEAVIDLFPYAKTIYLVIRSEGPKGDPVTMDKVASNPEVRMIAQADTEEILGADFVTGLRYKDRTSGESKELKIDGVFVEIGAVPNSEIAKGLADINEKGEIVVDAKTQRSSDPGIWAAGDVCDSLYKQNNTSAGDAIKAVLNVYERLVKG